MECVLPCVVSEMFQKGVQFEGGEAPWVLFREYKSQVNMNFR